MFFDIHTHAFHPKIAHKAVDHLNTVYHLDCRGDGTIEHLLEREKAAGIDRCHRPLCGHGPRAGHPGQQLRHEAAAGT